MHRTLSALAWPVGIVASALAANPGASPADRPGSSALTVAAITELTDAGRKSPAPTADRPVYVLTHSGGRRDFGRQVAGQEAPSDDSLVPQLEAALVADHFLAATGEHPPSLLLIFNWGLHANLDANMEDPGYTNVLDRAALVGGSKFAADLKEALKADELAAAATPTQNWGAQLPGMNPTRATILFQSFSPVASFRKRDQLTRRLLDQACNDCYYVVVSALDYAALARGERRVLWRTKLTAPALGAPFGPTIAALVKAGAGRYGRDMSGPEMFSAPTD